MKKITSQDVELEKYKGTIFKHFKGNYYLLIDIAVHSETREKLVIYKALYGDCMLTARPIDMFLSKVNRIKYPDVKQTYRFEPVELKSRG